jgi:hypothetical protein
VSFTSNFLNQLSDGVTIKEAYENGSARYISQVKLTHPKALFNSNIANQPIGLMINASGSQIVKHKIPDSDTPLDTDIILYLEADNIIENKLAKAWSIITPPQTITPPKDAFEAPQIKTEKIELEFNIEHSRYENSKKYQFIKDGIYTIQYFLEDLAGDLYQTDIESFKLGESDMQIEYAPRITDINISKGWHLVGLGGYDNVKEHPISEKVNIIWDYENGIWKAYSSNQNLTKKLIDKKYEILTKINESKGYWVFSSKNNQYKHKSINWDFIDFEQLNSGWHLLSSSRDINLEEESIKVNILWQYNNKWSAYSSNPDIKKELEKLNYYDNFIKAGSGFWVNVE